MLQAIDKNAGSLSRLDALAASKSSEDRIEAARQGHALHILIGDRSPLVREAVAQQGYRLDILVNDPALLVRCAVIEQGVFPDKDPCKVKIKEQVLMINHKFFPDRLVYSDSPYIRHAVASASYALDEYVDDDNVNVRAAVINQGYDIDMFSNDDYTSFRSDHPETPKRSLIRKLRNPDPDGRYAQTLISFRPQYTISKVGNENLETTGISKKSSTTTQIAFLLSMTLILFVFLVISQIQNYVSGTIAPISIGFIWAVLTICGMWKMHNGSTRHIDLSALGKKTINYTALGVDHSQISKSWGARASNIVYRDVRKLWKLSARSDQKTIEEQFERLSRNVHRCS